MRKAKAKKKREIKENITRPVPVTRFHTPFETIKENSKKITNKCQTALLIKLAIDCLIKHRKHWDHKDAYLQSSIKAKLTKAINSFKKYVEQTDLFSFLAENMSKEEQEREKKYIIDSLVAGTHFAYEFKDNDRLIIASLEWALVLLDTLRGDGTQIRGKRVVKKDEYNLAIKGIKEYVDSFMKDTGIEFIYSDGKKISMLLG